MLGAEFVSSIPYAAPGFVLSFRINVFSNNVFMLIQYIKVLTIITDNDSFSSILLRHFI